MTLAQSAGATPPRPYLDELSAALDRSRQANRHSLTEAAAIVERVVAGDGLVFAFGSGHSQLAVLDLNRRAGSIAALQVVFDPTWGAAECVAGYGETLLADAAPGPRDCLIVISHSGRTVAAIDVAARAAAAGATVIAVTSRPTSRSAPESSGPRLWELADVLLDDGAPNEDSGTDGHRRARWVAPTSTVVATALLHEVIAEAIGRMAARGVEAPVLRSNSDIGGRQHNERLRDLYRARVRLVP
jgi:uncharacterized phosphosugar-binding protein